MVLSRALVHWFLQSRQQTLSLSNTAASDGNERPPPRNNAMNVLSSLLQSPRGIRSPVDQSSPSRDSQTRPPALFTPALISSLPLIPPSLRDGAASATDGVLSSGGRTSTADAEQQSLQMMTVDSRRSVPRPLPTFTSFGGLVFTLLHYLYTVLLYCPALLFVHCYCCFCTLCANE